jgi:hypothetical protein
MEGAGWEDPLEDRWGHQCGSRAGHNLRCQLISPLSVDLLSNGTTLSFYFQIFNIINDRFFWNQHLKRNFPDFFKLTLSTLYFL